MPMSYFTISIRKPPLLAVIRAVGAMSKSVIAQFHNIFTILEA